MQQKIQTFAYKYKGIKLAGFLNLEKTINCFLEFVKNISFE